MRTLALLLLLLNISFLIWQLGLLPWLPWQPEQFKPINQPNSSDEASHLPQLLLIGESNAPTEAEKTQVSVEDATPKQKDGANIANNNVETTPKKESAKPLTEQEKPAKPPQNIVSTLKQVAGLSTSATNNSSAENKSKDEEVTASTKPVAKKITKT